MKRKEEEEHSEDAGKEAGANTKKPRTLSLRIFDIYI